VGDVTVYLRQEKSSQKCNATNYPTENKRPQKIFSPCGSQQPARCVAAEREIMRIVITITIFSQPIPFTCESSLSERLAVLKPRWQLHLSTPEVQTAPYPDT
jgi:hypothetical protein